MMYLILVGCLLRQLQHKSDTSVSFLVYIVLMCLIFLK